MRSETVAPVGITMAGARGTRTVYNLAGSSGLARLSNDVSYTSSDGSGFRARLVSVPLGELAYEDLDLSSFVCERSGQVPAPMAPDTLRLMRVLEGAVRIERAGNETLAGPGQWVLILPRKPFRMSADGPARSATVVIPVRSLRVTRQHLESIAFRPLAPSAAEPAFAALLRELSSSAPDDNTAEADLLAHALLDLSRALLAASGEDDTQVDSDRALLRRAHDIIERNYTDPNLHVSSIADRMGISTRRLHRLFEDEPLSISLCIRRWRVTAATRDLLVTQDSFETIAARVGFGSADSAYRSFREQQGMSPAEYRRHSQMPITL